MTLTIDAQKQQAAGWFRQLRDDICQSYQALETTATFQRTPWQHEQGGGGEMSVMRGQVFEKVGVNISTVYGEFAPAFRDKIAGTENSAAFWASGISIVAHPASPLVPAAHFNTRFIVTEKSWFGGGGDLTPVFPDDVETAAFHGAFKQACDTTDLTYYPRFKQWCDDYFFLPHRNEPRGVGGIFYDNLQTGNFNTDFGFTQNVGKAFYTVYPQLVAAKMHLPFTEQQRQAQLQKRSRYVEFNLLYDRGTLFGLKTGGNIDAILMSLPPLTGWA